MSFSRYLAVALQTMAFTMVTLGLVSSHQSRSMTGVLVSLVLLGALVPFFIMQVTLMVKEINQ